MKLAASHMSLCRFSSLFFTSRVRYFFTLGLSSNCSVLPKNAPLKASPLSNTGSIPANGKALFVSRSQGHPRGRMQKKQRRKTKTRRVMVCMLCLRSSVVVMVYCFCSNFFTGQDCLSVTAVDTGTADGEVHIKSAMVVVVVVVVVNWEMFTCSEFHAVSKPKNIIIIKPYSLVINEHWIETKFCRSRRRDFEIGSRGLSLWC